MADLAVLREIENLPDFVERVKGTDLAALLNQAEPADLETLAGHIASTSDLTLLLAAADAADRAAVIDAFIDKAEATVLERVATGISTPGELRELLDIAGDDDERMTAFIAKAGPESVLDRVFALMPTRLLREKMDADTADVEWHVNVEDAEYVYTLHIAAGQAEGARGPAKGPRITLMMSAPNLMRLCAGTLDGVSGFMAQKIRLLGDMMFGAKLTGAFDTTS